VQLVLARLDGVHKAEVSFSQQQAQVVYLPDKVTVQQMIDAVRRAGFGAEVIQKGG
jgi:copper chaperone CopZ